MQLLLLCKTIHFARNNTHIKVNSLLIFLKSDYFCRRSVRLKNTVVNGTPCTKVLRDLNFLQCQAAGNPCTIIEIQKNHASLCSKTKNHGAKKLFAAQTETKLLHCLKPFLSFKEPFISFLIRKIHLRDQGSNVGAAVSALLALIAKMYLVDQRSRRKCLKYLMFSSSKCRFEKIICSSLRFQEGMLLNLNLLLPYSSLLAHRNFYGKTGSRSQGGAILIQYSSK